MRTLLFSVQFFKKNVRYFYYYILLKPNSPFTAVFYGK